MIAFIRKLLRKDNTGSDRMKRVCSITVTMYWTGEEMRSDVAMMGKHLDVAHSLHMVYTAVPEIKAVIDTALEPERRRFWREE